MQGRGPVTFCSYSSDTASVSQEMLCRWGKSMFFAGKLRYCPMSNKLPGDWLSTRSFAQGHCDPKDVRTILNLINIVGADLDHLTSNPAIAQLSQRHSIMGSRVRLAAMNASIEKKLDEPDESDDPPTSASVWVKGRKVERVVFSRLQTFKADVLRMNQQPEL